MQREDLLVYVRRASRTQIATGAAVAALLFAAFLAALPFLHTPLPRYHATIPVIDTVLLLGDGITATILFTQASILKSRALIALASGYLYSAVIIVPRALSFPDAFAPQGVIGGGINTTIWLYFFWHSGLPIAVIAYALLQRRPQSRRDGERPMRPIVAWSVAGSVTTALLLTMLATEGYALLPAPVPEPINWQSGFLSRLALTIGALLLAALALVWRGRKSLLDIWLMVTLWAWLLEIVLILMIPDRYTLGWYSGRIAGMLSGVLVLLALLIETSRLYMQTALAAVSEQQHREARLMSLDAAAAAIAHEVRQPITAMVTNASAALVRMQHEAPDLPKVTRGLQSIVDDGHRASDTIASIRALFGNRAADRAPADINQLIRETLDLLSVEIASRGIVTSLALAPRLPLLEVERLQMRQVFLNLVNNAIDALGERPAGPRRIVIRSEASEDGGVAIDVADTGRGIPADQTDRIFDAFVTTKAYGTGMGLPLCRSIVEGHGGKLWVSSIEGRGATFHIQLPGSGA